MSVKNNYIDEWLGQSLFESADQKMGRKINNDILHVPKLLMNDKKTQKCLLLISTNNKLMNAKIIFN